MLPHCALWDANVVAWCGVKQHTSRAACESCLTNSPLPKPPRKLDSVCAPPAGRRCAPRAHPWGVRCTTPEARTLEGCAEPGERKRCQAFVGVWGVGGLGPFKPRPGSIGGCGAAFVCDAVWPVSGGILAPGATVAFAQPHPVGHVQKRPVPQPSTGALPRVFVCAFVSCL
jgi:hypothetical protein